MSTPYPVVEPIRFGTIKRHSIFFKFRSAVLFFLYLLAET